jgi:uncharacterized protein YndB with AHSA1/START domain
MHGPNGVDYPNHATFLEVKKHACMVYDHGSTDEGPPLFRVTALFSQAGDQTTVAMTMAFESAQAADESRKFIKQAGGETTWDRFAEYLAKQKSGNEVFVITRSFDAPLLSLYQMWTDTSHLSKWLAPNGTMTFIKSEIRPGGSTFSVMRHGAESPPMYGRADYIELSQPHRVVYTQQFCDELENIVRHPMAATWPETMLTIVTLVEEGEQQTRVTLTWQPHGAVSAEEVATFVNARSGMTLGWTGSFDGLESYLAEVVEKIPS